MSGPVKKITGGIGKAFGSIFGALTPNMPDAPDPLIPPTVDDAQMSRIEQRRLLRRHGRRSTLVSDENNRGGSIGVNKLLGGGA